MRSRSLGLFAVVVASASLFASNDAHAFNPSTHRRIVETAVDSMQVSQPAPPAPAGVTPAQWSAFLGRLKPAVDKLDLLYTGLEPAWSVLGFNNPETCEYHVRNADGRELNLLHPDVSRIKEFKYYPGGGANLCTYSPQMGPQRPVTPLGAVLGWHAASIDARDDDQILTVRPTSVAFAGLLQEGASRITETALGSLFFVITCAADLLDGGDFSLSSCSRDAFDLSRKVNPVEYLQGLIPGIGRYTNEDFGGLFHFVDVEANLYNRYNDPRGLFYENAGPNYPGAVDVAIMIATDLLGLTLDPSSLGIDFYGRYDRVQRSDIQWQAHSLGHTELSPVSNLGHFGWDMFDKYGNSDASWLGFPLHAIGDSAAPHHVVGTTSWGHRPFEDAVANKEDALLLRVDDAGFAAQQARVLGIAFGALRDFDGDPSVANFVIREARGTRQLAENDGDWVYKDGASIEYLTPGRVTESIDSYRSDVGRMRPFVEQAIGQTIAFLVKAGERATGPDRVNELSLCPAGEYYTGVGTGCRPGTPPSPPNVSEPIGFVPVSCQDNGATCTVATDCCGGLICIGGHCSNPPPPCGNVGASCSAGGDCCSPLTCSGGQCAASGPACGGSGTSCSSDANCCEPLVCAGGRCGVQSCPGLECTSSDQCGNVLCLRGCCDYKGPK